MIATINPASGEPATRRLPYNDFGIVTHQQIVAGPNPQTVSTADN